MFFIISRLPAFYILGVLWTILFGLFLYSVIYMWLPAETRNHELTSEVSKTREEIIHIIRLNEFSKNYSSLKQELKIYETRLNSPLSQSDLTEKLYLIASKNRVTVLSESNKKRLDDSLKITMKSLLVEGKYTNIRKYLYDLNRLKSMSFIRRVELKHKKKSHKIKASIQLVVYTMAK